MKRLLQFCADSVETCPSLNFDHSTSIACGQYELITDTGSRCGGISMYTHDPKKNTLDQGVFVESPAVLDMKWHKTQLESPILAVATAESSIQLWKHDRMDSSSLLAVDCISLNTDKDHKELALSLDWGSSLNSQNIITSTSDGYLCLVSVDHNHVDRWHANDYESWISAYDYHQPNTVYSGGDDCMWKQWDLRDTSHATHRSNEHSMGVTAIQCHYSNDTILATGSYDERVIVWDKRKLQKPLMAYKTDGGGIWRIKWHPNNPDVMVTACMHDGVHVLEMSSDGSLKCLQVNRNVHQSMAYGVDFVGDNVNSIASCSFYDKLFAVWSFPA